MILGTDISRWEDNPETPQEIDFDKMKKSGARFVFFKATQGTKIIDKVFQISWADAKTAGLIRGAYFYMDWTASGLDQAKYFCDVVYDKGDNPELPPVVDFECRVNIPQNACGHLWNALDYIQQHTGKIPLIYTSPSYWKEYGTPHPAWKKYPLWIANYNVQKPNIPLPWTDYIFWQFTDKADGKLFGAESLEIDLNWFNGDEAAFQIFIGNILPPPTLTLEEKVEKLLALAKLHGWEV